MEYVPLDDYFVNISYQTKDIILHLTICVGVLWHLTMGSPVRYVIWKQYHLHCIHSYTYSQLLFKLLLSNTLSENNIIFTAFITLTLSYFLNFILCCNTNIDSIRSLWCFSLLQAWLFLKLHTILWYIDLLLFKSKI